MPLASRQRNLRACETCAIAGKFVAAPLTASVSVQGPAAQARTMAGTENRMRTVSERERALASILPYHIIFTLSSCRTQFGIRLRLKKADGFAAGAGLEAALGAAAGNIDDVHGAVALAGDEQFVAAERHVHRLRADLDRGLLAERRIDQAHRIAVEAGDAEQAVVRRVTRDLRRLRHVLEHDLFAQAAGFGVDEEQCR